MEHFFHFFGLGGSCGEHMVWPMLGSIGVGFVFARSFIKRQCRRVYTTLRKPAKDKNTPGTRT